MLETTNGTAVYYCAAEGTKFGSDQDAIDLMGDLWHDQPDMVVIPVERFADGFFQLETRMAGGIIQKFVSYGLRLVILGEISGYVEQSSALASFVYESNRGKHLWFMANREDLVQRLTA